MDVIDTVETAVLNPTSIEEAVELLAKLDHDGKVLAGGQSLLSSFASGSDPVHVCRAQDRRS